MGKTIFRGDWAMQDGTLLPISELTFVEEGTIVYEVVRFKRGIPLFLEDHFIRFSHSAQKTGGQIGITLPELGHQLAELALKNGFSEGNVMLKVKMEGLVQKNLWHFIPHSYPVAFDYTYGVCLGILHAERPNPEAKVLNLDVRQQANQMILEGGYSEVLLVNNDGLVTEGSRSNFLLFKGNEIFSASPDKILMGITLKKVLEICERESLTVHSACIHENRLGEFDAACISGTSPGILPVSTIGTVGFDVKHQLLQQLMQLYENEVEQYILKNSYP